MKENMNKREDYVALYKIVGGEKKKIVGGAI